MQSYCSRIFIFSDRLDLYCHLGKIKPFLTKPGPFENNWIISFWDDKHPNNSFISVNDEVATKFICIFFGFCFLRQFAAITHH